MRYTLKKRVLSKTTFECQDCGYISSKWLGKCPSCGVWDSFIEGVSSKKTKLNSSPLNRAVPITDVVEDNISRFSNPK